MRDMMMRPDTLSYLSFEIERKIIDFILSKNNDFLKMKDVQRCVWDQIECNLKDLEKMEINSYCVMTAQECNIMSEFILSRFILYSLVSRSASG